MIRKLGTVLVLSGALVVGACGASIDTSTGPLTTDLTKARIRVANATNTAFDVNINDNVFLTGGNIGNGASICAFVDPANPALTLKTVATSTTPSTPVAGLVMPTLTVTANTDYQLIVYNVG